MPSRRGAQPGPEPFEEVCRRHGLPLTIQRRATLEALAARSDHPTADQILEDVRKHMPEISRTTVYRVLEALVRIGIARKVCHPGAAARYETETRRHHHLVCLNCESMVDIYAPHLDRLRLPDVNSYFHIEDYSIQFRGLCSDCARQPSIRRAKPTTSGPVAGKVKTGKGKPT
jgi:Fur family peroxide stress response transcriptional regulator